jgi:hypothetical protein
MSKGTASLVLLVVMLTVIACGGSSDPAGQATSPVRIASPSPTQPTGPTATSTRPPTPTFAPTITPTATATLEPSPTPETTHVPIKQSGTGDKNVSVELTAGVTLFTLQHFGPNRFSVRLLTEDDEGRGLLVNDRGAFQGSRAVAIREPGTFVLEIKASGDWEFEVVRPVPDDASTFEVPFEHAGTGVQALYFVKAEPGLHVVTLTHDGTGPFIVSVMNSKGQAFERIVDTTGKFSGRVAARARNAPFDYLIFELRTDANWTIRVE